MKENQKHKLKDLARELLGALSVEELAANSVLSQKAYVLFRMLERRA